MEYVIQASYSQLQDYQSIVDSYPVGIEITDFAYPSNYGLEGEKLVDLWKTSDVIGKVVGLHGSYYDLILHSLDQQIAEITRKRYLWNLGIVDQIETEYCIFHTNYQPEHHSKRYMERWIYDHGKFLQNHASQYQCTVALENMRDPIADHLNLLITSLKDYQPWICLDIAHFYSYAEQAIEIWIEQIDEIQIIHLKDRTKPGEELALGVGDIPWQDILPLVEDIQPNYLVIEMEGEDKISTSLDYLDQHL